MTEEERKLSVTEVRRTIATSLATAFGFVIALVWKEVVMGGLVVAGVNLEATPELASWTYFVVTALMVTIMMIILIIVISRWGGKKQAAS
ncbi:MAG: DUF5654 family protein [Thermoplasmata archaeon]